MAGDRRPWYADRTTGDLLILVLSVTVCVLVFTSGLTLAVLAFVQPQRDSSAGFAALGNVVNTLIGLLAGFLTGRADYARQGERERLRDADE